MASENEMNVMWEQQKSLTTLNAVSGAFSIIINKFVAGPVLRSHYFAGQVL